MFTRSARRPFSTVVVIQASPPRSISLLQVLLQTILSGAVQCLQNPPAQI